MKTCTTCKYFKKEWDVMTIHPLCTNTKVLNAHPDMLVWGDVEPPNAVDCYDARIDMACGPTGKYWVKKVNKNGAA